MIKFEFHISSSKKLFVFLSVEEYAMFHLRACLLHLSFVQLIFPLYNDVTQL